jgi:uncharacterized repeat protein (TIGR01451 family)
MPSAERPPAGLTHEDWGRLRRAVEASEYHASRVSGPGEASALQAPNRNQAYRTTFRPEGIEIVPRAQAGTAWRLGVSVMGYGYEGDVQAVADAKPQARKDRVEYRRGPLTEWYVNRPEGLEQGFELQEPRSRRRGPLVVAMAVTGDLDVSASNGCASFAKRSGETPLRYAGLKAWDAEGRPLQSRLEAAGREVRVLVDAQAARFPVTVDPTFIHEAQLFGHTDAGQANAGFGFSVSVSGDTAVVGEPFANLFNNSVVDAGAANVFVRSGTGWALQQRLLASDGSPGDFFGYSVSLSGNTLVVGAVSDDTPAGVNSGSAYVFVRSGTVWTQQQKLLAPDGAADDSFSYSVSVSVDTVVVGAPRDDTPAGVDAGSAYVFVRSGTTWSQQQKLVASDGMLLDNFGRSVSLSADTAVVGADFDDTPGGEDAGSAYVFVRSGSTWTEQQHLLASDGAAGDHLGISVSVSGDTVVAGAWADDTPGGVDAGSAYVFVRSGSTWTEQQKLLASDGAAFDNFGMSASISGDTVVVGVDQAPGGVAVGAAYVFVRSGTTWTEQQKLLASDGAASDAFGIAVSVDANTAVIGADIDDLPGGVNAGSAYVFARSGTAWTQQQKLLSPDTLDSSAFDNVGHSVSVSGDTVVVGAIGDNTLVGGDAGSVYVFVRSGTSWTEQQKLFASDAVASTGFGFSVSASGDTVVVGAVRDVPPFGPGSAYVFVRSGTTWSQQQKLLASDGAQGDFFGQSVSVSGDTVVVGAYRDDTPAGVDAGSAYVFVRSGTTWSEQQKLVASDGAQGDLFGNSVSISGDTVVVGAYGDDTPAGSFAGSAYVFVRSGTSWTQQQKLLASDGAQNDHFGFSVSISGDTVVVGADGDDTPAGGDAGSAYVFVRSGTWTQQQKLLASDGAAFDIFGSSVSVSGDIAVIGAPFHDTPVTPSGPDAGSSYVFVRSGTSWVEQQQLLAPDAAERDEFGWSVSVSASTVVVGAHWDDTPSGTDAGSAHVFRRVPDADLAVTKTDGQATATPGHPLTYSIVASNAGPTAVTGATVADVLPAALLGATWTCSPSAGSACTASGSGNINDSVTLAVGGTATYSVTGTVDPAATGTVSNTVGVTPPPGTPDPNPSNNGATDVDVLVPETDLGITKTDSADPVSPGDPLTYVLNVGNAGPSDSVQVSLSDPLPPGVTFVSSTPGPPTCLLAGGVLYCNLFAMPAGGTATVAINVTVNSSAIGVLVNTATVSSNETDPDPSNNSATATTLVRGGKGELTHGTEAVHDLAAQPGPVADQDVFLISQKPFSSYEVVVDATSGDIGVGSGPLLQRIGSDGTTALQSSVAVGTGSARSLRWRNTTSAIIEDQTVRVASAQCGTDCGPDDVYRIRAYETTYSVPRFNNAGTQITVLVLQNPTSYPIAGEVYFDSASGSQVAVHPFSLGPKETLILNTAAVPGAGGVSGALTIAHDGRYGDLSGKTVALEPATGFSFDSALEPRPK